MIKQQGTYDMINKKHYETYARCKKTEEQNMNITKETDRWKVFAYQL